MIRGTTPTHSFTTNLHTSQIKEVKITYAQSDEVVFCKRTGDCTFEDYTISTTLTQEETLSLDCKRAVQIQIRVLTFDGQSMSTQVKPIPVEKCLDNEVLA